MTQKKGHSDTTLVGTGLGGAVVGYLMGSSTTRNVQETTLEEYSKLEVSPETLYGVSKTANLNADAQGNFSSLFSRREANPSADLIRLVSLVQPILNYGVLGHHNKKEKNINNIIGYVFGKLDQDSSVVALDTTRNNPAIQREDAELFDGTQIYGPNSNVAVNGISWGVRNFKKGSSSQTNNSKQIRALALLKAFSLDDAIVSFAIPKWIKSDRSKFPTIYSWLYANENWLIPSLYLCGLDSIVAAIGQIEAKSNVIFLSKNTVIGKSDYAYFRLPKGYGIATHKSSLENILDSNYHIVHKTDPTKVQLLVNHTLDGKWTADVRSQISASAPDIVNMATDIRTILSSITFNLY